MSKHLLLNLCKSLLLREERIVGKNQNVFNKEVRKYSIELGKRVSRGRDSFSRGRGVCGEGVSYLGTNFGRVIQLVRYTETQFLFQEYYQCSYGTYPQNRPYD